MGCCLMTIEDKNCFHFEINKTDYDIESLGKPAKSDFYSFSNSSSIIMFEGGKSISENCLSTNNSKNLPQSTEKTWEE
ncbi:hypothetical protein SteCoe_1246 [Stentor coeruleus]|uniref:Uncharacterized protein n=1 Tax=Stentor coeruleus TaxID=5963 RepID=A0A1R2D276_9CILI|nr:hypothetical protein SteCoe_1246 [Stentor coeruleus]